MTTALTVTVVTGRGSSAHQIDLSREAAMVKAALLYGDRVQLVSFQAVAISTVAAAYAASGPDRARLIERLLSEQDPTSALLVSRLEDLRRRSRRTDAEMRDLARLEELVQRGGDLIQDSLRGILGESGLSELMPAAEAGLLTIHPLGLNDGQGLDEGLADRFGDVVRSLVTPGSNAFPLLDDQAGRLAQAIAGEAGLSLVIGGRAREMRLAGGLLESLPAFPNAPMSAVLEARDSLAGPLVKFRSAIITLARTIEELPGDPDFPARVADVWRSDVAPALEELAEAEQDRGLRRLLTHSIIEASPSRVVEAGLAAVSMAIDSIPMLLASAAAASVDVLTAASRRYRSRGEDMTGNRFLLLFEADKRFMGK